MEPDFVRPAFNRVSDIDEIRRMVAAIGAAELITVGSDGYPQATLLPVTWTGDVVTTHVARPNPHWKEIPDGAPPCSSAQDLRRWPGATSGR
jgi:transcriptional regulator